MMDTGAGVEVNLFPVSHSPAGIPASMSDGGFDFFAQAEKALTERSPFDVEMSEKDSGQGLGGSVTTLPAGLVGWLAKYMDNRRKHKKSHSVVESKKKTSVRQKRLGNIWNETEVYFRELTLSDVKTLFQLSTFLTPGCMEYLAIPAVRDAVFANRLHNANADNYSSGEEMYIALDTVSVDDTSCDEMVPIEVAIDDGAFTRVSGNEMVSDEVPRDIVTATCMSDDEMVSVGIVYNSAAATCRSNNIVSDGILIDSAVATGSRGEEMDVDNEKMIKTETEMNIEQETGTGVNPGEEEYSSLYSCLRPSVSAEWVLPSKQKILLASEQPLKKRKLLSENAGLEKLFVGQSCEGNQNLCHYCSQGDFDSEQSVTVHRKCYGIVKNDIIDSTWLCSWCKHTNDSGELAARDMSGDSPCLLCPKQEGALKPLKTKDAGNLGPLKFAHVFCSQWLSEITVKDTKLMKPIVNVDTIDKTRGKLICSLCKGKHGACVRCSNGTCRACIHPICAREANHRTEIWGKAANNDAFCSKHSDVSASNEDVQQVDSPSTIGDYTSLVMISSEAALNGHDESKLGWSSGNISDMQLEAPCNNKFQVGEFVGEALQNGRVVMDLKPENCSSEHSLDAVAPGVDYNEGVKPSVAFLLKRLIDRGKVDLDEISLEMGMPPGSLAATLATGTLTPESQYKAVSWIKSHAYLGNWQRHTRVKIKTIVCSDFKMAEVALEPDALTAVPVKSVSPRRRTASNVRIPDVDGSSFLSKGELDDETIPSEAQVHNTFFEPNGTIDASSHDSIEKILPNPTSISSVMEPSTAGTVPGNPSFPVGGSAISDPRFVNEGPPSYIHMSVYGKLMQFKTDKGFPEADDEPNVCRRKHVDRLDLSPSDGIYHHLETNTSASSEPCSKDMLLYEELINAKVLGVYDVAPEDELEGELVYFQHLLLDTKLKKKRICDGLVYRVVKSLPSQIDFVRSHRWDSIYVNMYLAEVREAKKQDRKEKRRKEAQALLAAATATAASSSRISTLRKDDLDESYRESPATASHVLRPDSQSLMPLLKETVSRKAVSEKESDFLQSNKDNPRSCDVCCRPETILSSILVCSICKVSVHLNCYRSIQNFIGPWHCEVCEDVTSRCSRPLPTNSWERSTPSTDCAVCGGTVGAFRKCSDGRWIHAFCAEWTLQSTFRRGQIDPIEGLESITMGNDVCCVCRLKKGVCLKCHYGHCQSTFHPSCARSYGFYMNIISSGNKILHKGYCKKHSSEQRSKDKNQKHGTDELKSIKQARVQLERLRLLCERIVRREKLKRDLLICSHAILASKKDSVAFSVLVRSPFMRPGVSSDSATTSLNNSDCEAIHKLDDMAVAISSSVMKPPNLVKSIENDQKTDNCSTMQLVFARKQTQRMPCAGKKIPIRTLSLSRNLSDDSANKSTFREV